MMALHTRASIRHAQDNNNANGYWFNNSIASRYQWEKLKYDTQKSVEGSEKAL